MTETEPYAERSLVRMYTPRRQVRSAHSARSVRRSRLVSEQTFPPLVFPPTFNSLVSGLGARLAGLAPLPGLALTAGNAETRFCAFSAPAGLGLRAAHLFFRALRFPQVIQKPAFARSARQRAWDSAELITCRYGVPLQPAGCEPFCGPRDRLCLRPAR